MTKLTELKVTRSRVYHGPSIYANVPVVLFRLNAVTDVTIDRQLVDSFISQLPDPAARQRLDNRLDDIDLESAESRTRRLFESLCVELQLAAGCEVTTLYTSNTDALSAAEAVVAYEEGDVCVAAAELACEVISKRSAAESTIEAVNADFGDLLDKFITRSQRMMLPIQDRVLTRKARSFDIPVNRLTGRLVVLGQGRFQQRVSGTKTTHTNIIGNDIAANKDYSRRVLGECGLPIPQYARANRIRAAVAAARKIGYPVVVKPNNGQMGRGVSIGLKSARDVRAAYKRAREYGQSVLIEEMISGSDYRMIVINGKLCAASKREPGHIVGDGIRNIQELVDEVNSDPRRGEGPKYSWTRIKIDDQANRLLAELNYSLESVPGQDEVVYLRRNANTSDGGTAIDVTDDVHPDNAAIAIRAAKAIGLDISGVDILTEDISKSMLAHGGAICEVNSRPGLRKHLWPAEGKPRDVLSPVIEMLFPEGSNGRIKTVIVTGSGNRNAAARLLAQQLADQGSHVGLSTDEGAEINGTLIQPEVLDRHAAARMILMDPDVDAAVFELAPREILRRGLDLDAADVCVVVEDENTSRKNKRNKPTKTQLRTEAALKVVAGIARDAIVLVSSDESSYAALASASLARIHRLDTMAKLHAKVANCSPIFAPSAKRRTGKFADRLSPRRTAYTLPLQFSERPIKGVKPN